MLSLVSRKTACGPEPHPTGYWRLTVFVFFDSCLLLTPRVRILWASAQSRTRDSRPMQLVATIYTRVSLNVVGAAPELVIQAIPPQANPANHCQVPANLTCQEDRAVSSCDARIKSSDIGHVRGAVTVSPSTQIVRNPNETGAGIGRRVSIPPSACLPPLAVCFAVRAPARGA